MSKNEIRGINDSNSRVIKTKKEKQTIGERKTKKKLHNTKYYYTVTKIKRQLKKKNNDSNE